MRRVRIYQCERLVGTVPMPKTPFAEFYNMYSHKMEPDRFSFEPFNLGIKRKSVDDLVASMVTFSTKMIIDDNGWTMRGALVCDQWYGPGDLKCIPGFVPKKEYQS